MTMIMVSDQAGDKARVQQLMQGLAREASKHEAVPHTGGRAGEDGGHCHHGDREEHHNHTLALVLCQNIVQEVTNIGDTLLKCLETDTHLEKDINVIMVLLSFITDLVAVIICVLSLEDRDARWL